MPIEGTTDEGEELVQSMGFSVEPMMMMMETVQKLESMELGSLMTVGCYSLMVGVNQSEIFQTRCTCDCNKIIVLLLLFVKL